MRGGMEQSDERHRPPSLLSTPHTAHQPASRALPTSLLDVHPQWICLPFFLAGCPLIQKCLELGTGRGGCRGGGRACAHPHGHGRGMRPPDDPRPRYAGRGPSPRQAPCRITASPLATVFTASGHASKPCLLSLRTHSPPFPLPPPPPFPHTIWPHLGLPALHRRSAEAGLPAHQEPLLHERFLRVMPASIGLENVRPLPGMPRPSVSREEVGPPPPCRSSAVHLMLAMRSKRSGPYSRGWAAPPLSLPGLVIPAASITRCTAASAAPRSGKCADSWQVRPSACP